MVTNIEPGLIWMGETELKADVIVWAAGVAASPLGKKLGVAVDRAGRVLVEHDLSIPGIRKFLSSGTWPRLKTTSGKLLAGRRAGSDSGRTICRQADSPRNRGWPNPNGNPAPRQPFHYLDKGNLATIGRAAAVAQFGRIHISGFIAWLAWLFVHIFFLIGLQNRVLVFIQWAWSYFTYERGARLITGSTNLPGWNESDDPRRAKAEKFLP